MKTILQENCYDVAVCGGGFAGVSAALSASREGKKVVLFEKQYMLGGLGTAGLIAVYLPICDGLGKQVSFGLAEELLKLSIKYGAEGSYPENWLDRIGTKTEKDKRFEVQYNPQVCGILLEQLLLENNVEIIYGSYVTGVKIEEQKISYIEVENKEGKVLYKANSYVDATGDCDIANFANLPTETFSQGNVVASWYYYSNEKGYNLVQLGFADIPDEEKIKKGIPLDKKSKRFSGLSGKDLSEMTFLSHKNLLENWLAKKEKDPNVALSTIPTIPQVRMTRKLVGEYVQTHLEKHTYFEDSIGMVSDWRMRGPIYEVPFRTLYNSKIKNLIVAGRCTSVDQTLWNIMRVIPCCVVTGQAAGLAASMTDDFSSLSVNALQQKLIEQGVKLHEKDL